LKKKCIIEIYQNSKLSKTFTGVTPDDVWQKTGILPKFRGQELFGLASEKTQEILHNHYIPKCFVHEWNNIELIEKFLFIISNEEH